MCVCVCVYVCACARVHVSVCVCVCVCVCICVVMLTLVPADLNVGQQAGLNDLPEEPKDQVGFPSHQVAGVDVHHRAADGRRRVQGQVQVLLHGNGTVESGGAMLMLSFIHWFRSSFCSLIHLIICSFVSFSIKISIKL